MTTATCQTTSSRATGPRSGSQRSLPLNMNVHRPRAALEAIVHVTLIRNALTDDVGLERGFHQPTELGPEEPKVRIGHTVARVGEHVLEDLGALVEHGGAGRDIGGQGPGGAGGVRAPAPGAGTGVG